MDHDFEIRSLAAETIAIQMVLGQVLLRLVRSDPKLANVIRGGFDDAANIVEQFAIKMGTAAKPEHTVKALQVVEELRSAVFGSSTEPKHGV